MAENYPNNQQTYQNNQQAYQNNQQAYQNNQQAYQNNQQNYSNNPQYYPQQQYVSSAPVAQLKTNRGALKYILLSLITFGIYGIVAMSQISGDVNVVCSRYDGKKTMHYCLLTFVIAPITAGIGAVVWMHKFCARIGTELQRRNIDYKFGAGTFWGWCVLGSLIGVGPFIYIYKMFKAMNLMCENFNQFG